MTYDEPTKDERNALHRASAARWLAGVVIGAAFWVGVFAVLA